MKNYGAIAEYVSYNKETGIFVWIKKPSRSVLIGTRAGEQKYEGYRRIKLNGSCYYEHRLAWYMENGFDADQIDHINGNRSDNRFCNLRNVCCRINIENQRKAKSNSSTGLLGVFVNKKGFMARIKVKGVNKYLGTFHTKEIAHEKYLDAKRSLHEGCSI